MVIRKGSTWAILTIRVRLLHEHLEHVVDPVLRMPGALVLDTTNGNATRADLSTCNQNVPAAAACGW